SPPPWQVAVNFELSGAPLWDICRENRRTCQAREAGGPFRPQRRREAMTMRLLALAFVLFAASPCYAGEDPGRYTMSTVGDSVWRLDTATGAMSVCGRTLDHWACESVADDALALKAEVDRLDRENRELKDKLAKAEEKEAEAGPEPANP